RIPAVLGSDVGELRAIGRPGERAELAGVVVEQRRVALEVHTVQAREHVAVVHEVARGERGCQAATRRRTHEGEHGSAGGARPRLAATVLPQPEADAPEALVEHGLLEAELAGSCADG